MALRKQRLIKITLEKIKLEEVVHALTSDDRAQTLCGIDMSAHHCIEMRLRCFCLGCRTRSLYTEGVVTCIECLVKVSELPEFKRTR